MRPLIFLDIDDVLAISREFTSLQVMASFNSGDLDSWPELWAGLILPEARTNLTTIHNEFWPQYVVSSSWSNYLTREQMKTVFGRTGLEFVAENLHKHWTTPKGLGPSRPGEIEAWIAMHRQPVRPVLVLDDHESGWNLVGSSLDYSSFVVLCEPASGFVAARLLDAQTQLRAQANSKITSGG